MNATVMADSLTLTQVDNAVLELAADRPIWEPLYLEDTLKRLNELMIRRRELRQQRGSAWPARRG
ncbi:MAG TPA: hypothetical protein VGL40_08030 [Bacillota bacterium]|jgi:hypothetical protein